MRRRKVQDGTAAIVRSDGKIIGLGHGCDLFALGNPSTPGDVRHDDSRGAIFKKLAKPPTGHQSLAQAERKFSRARQFGIGSQIILRQHLLQPHRLIGLQSGGDFDCAGQIPEAVKLDGDLDRVAKFLANKAQRFDCAAQLLRGNVIPAGFFSDRIKRPDLHSPNVACEQFSGETGGFAGEIHAVVAGVVNANGLPGCAAQKLVDRVARSLAKQIPQGDVDSADRPHFGAGPTAIGDGQKHIRPQAVYGTWIASQQHGGEPGMHDGRFRFRIWIALS